MPLPFLVAGAVAAAAVVYKRYRDEQQLAEQTASPGNGYRLPPCCMQALRTSTTRGHVLACLGATVAGAHLAGSAMIGRPRGLVETAKAVHDGGELVFMDWDETATLHADFARGVRTLAADVVLSTVYDHYAKHVGDAGSSDARKFWTRLYERLQRGSGTGYGRALQVLEEDSARWRAPAR